MRTVAFALILSYFGVSLLLWSLGILQPVSQQERLYRENAAIRYNEGSDHKTFPWHIAMPRDVVFIAILFVTWLVDVRLYIGFVLFSFLWLAILWSLPFPDVPARREVMFAAPLLLTVPFMAMFGVQLNME